MQIINRLRPVTFTWKESRERDIGLVAEEVAEVEPLLVTHNSEGQIEGIKYDRINVALINALNEQQQQIKRQQSEIEDLKRLLCAIHPKTEACQTKIPQRTATRKAAVAGSLR